MQLLILGAASVAAMCLLSQQSQAQPAVTVAETSSFAADSNGTPVSATTTFYMPIWTDGDPLDTAEHELMHAIGFAIPYGNYAAHVDNTTRIFCNIPASPCSSVLAQLMPSDDSHVDPNSGVVNGYDQAGSIMRPDLVVGQRIDGQENSVLNSAFNWSSNKINISVNYVGGVDVIQRGYIQSAVDAAHSLFGTSDSAPLFVWTVQVNQTSSSDTPVYPDYDRKTITDLIQLLNSSDAVGRTSVTREILRRGPTAAPALAKAGAKIMSGISPALQDVLYTLTSKEIAGRIRTNSFGLHLVPGTTRSQVVEMGRRRGFVLSDTDHFNSSSFPACYVTLTDGRDLLSTMENTFRNEQAVSLVNFNYFEH